MKRFRANKNAITTLFANFLKHINNDITNNATLHSVALFVQKTAITLLLWIAIVSSHSQNLVLNPSFEDYDSCGTYVGDFSSPFLHYWTCPNATTPEFFHACRPFGANPTSAYHGTQAPRNGQGIIGLKVLEYINDIDYPDVREFAQGVLQQLLKKDSFYCVRFYLSLAERGHRPIAKIGVYFADSLVYVPSNTLPFRPQMESPATQFFDDETGWQLWQHTYQAKGGEKYIIIGNFNTPANTPSIPPPFPFGFSEDSFSYYYIDDVSVVPLSSQIAKLDIGADTVVCAGVAFSHTLSVAAYYDSVVWSTGAVGHSIVVQQSGTYSVAAYYGDCAVYDTIHIRSQSPVLYTPIADTSLCADKLPLRIGATVGFSSYRWSTGDSTATATIRQPGVYTLMVADACRTVADTFVVNTITTPSPPLSIDTVLCSTEDTFGYITNYPLLWQNHSRQPLSAAPTISLRLRGEYSYYVAQKNGDCVSDYAHWQITVDSLPIVSSPLDYSFCAGGKVTVSLPLQQGWSYRWHTGDTTHSIQLSQAGIYNCVVNNECGNSQVDIAVKTIDCSSCVYIPTAFSPNNDGQNDVLQVYAKCPIVYFSWQLFNRWGEKVFETANEKEGWNGFYKNQSQPNGVYAYQLLLSTPEETIRLKGSVLLVR